MYHYIVIRGSVAAAVMNDEPDMGYGAAEVLPTHVCDIYLNRT